MARIGDRDVGERLAYDGDGYAVDLSRNVRLEHGITEVRRAHVLRDELDPPLQLGIDRLLYTRGAVGELPVAGHDVDPQQLRARDHVRAAGPQGRGRALPGIAAVEQQRPRPLRAHAFYQRGEVREAADPSVAARGILEIEMRVSVGQAAAGLDAVVLEQRLTDEMRRPALRPEQADVRVRFAEVEGIELRVAIRQVEQGDIAGRFG